MVYKWGMKMHKTIEKFIMSINADNYEHFIFASNKKELIENMKRYIVEEYEEEYTSEEINELIYWEGEGMYALAGYAFGCERIESVESILEKELFNHNQESNFPFSLNVETFSNFENWVEQIKCEEGFKYIYIICHNQYTNDKYTLEYLVYSQKKIDNLIEFVNEEENIFIGEFGELGSNYFVEELSEFNPIEIAQYDCSDYKVLRFD